jgi:hypothetical protein
VKARAYDLEILNALRPLEIAAYLRSRGWQQVERIGDAGSVWTQATKNGEGFEILLPYDRTYGDYLPRLADLLGTLEVAEERPQPAIVNDLLALNEYSAIKIDSRGVD